MTLLTRIATVDGIRPIIGTIGPHNRDVRTRATERSNQNASRMPLDKRRVDISFELERDALRAVANAFSRVRRPMRVGDDAVQAMSIERLVATHPASEAEDDRDAIRATTASELERFAHDAPGRDRIVTPRTLDRRADGRHGLLRHATAEASATLHFADRRAMPPPAASAAVAPAAVAPNGTAPAPADTRAMADVATAPDAARYLAALVAAYGPLEPADNTVTDAPLPDLLVIDASALPALARGNAQARAHLAHAVGALARIVVPATALVDAVHARVAHAVAEIDAVDIVLARLAAHLIVDTGLRLESTALAVACASRSMHGAVLTGNAAAAQRYTRALERPELVIFSI